MSFIYNEYGTMKNKKVQEVSDMIDTLARQLFKQLMEEEYSLSDIRLAAAYLEQAINVTACEEILRKAMKMSKEARSIQVNDAS
jgi:peroxiredoxin family protein